MSTRRCRFLLILATVWIWSGCGGEPRESADKTESTGPVAGGTAVIAVSSDPDLLNPLLYTSSVAGMIFAELHDGLTEMDDDLQYQPRIARGWEIRPDGMAITYHLRPWVWSDGIPLTARDVVLSFELFKDPEVASPRRGLYRDIVRAVEVDPATVRYEFDRPVPDPVQISWHHILPAHQLVGLDVRDIARWPLNRGPLSSGEFVLESWNPNREISLVRNDRYPGKAALLDRVVFRVLPETAARIAALEAGEVDLVDDLTPSASRRLEQTGNVRVEANGGRRFYYLQWNCNLARFRDAATRKALSLALDRERMIESLLLGFGTPAVGPIPPVLWNHHRDLRADAYDPAAARDLLAVAGWQDLDGDGILERDGEAFRFEILAKQGDLVRENGAVMVRDFLADVGVAVDLRIMEHAAGLARLRAGNFDCYFGLMNANLYGNPFGYVHSSATSEFNSGSYANATVDSLLETALALVDRDAALPVWLKLQEVLAEDPAAAYLMVPQNLVGVSLRLQDVRPHLLSPVNNLAEWWIETTDRKYRSH